jgi:hypothetical protein
MNESLRFLSILAAIFVSLFFTSGSSIFGTSLMPPPTRKTLARVWLAHAGDGIESARLELNDAGSGSFILNFSPAYRPRAFRVSAVQLDGYRVALTLLPIDRDPDGISVTGSATQYQIDLEVRGSAGTAKGVVSHIRFEPYERVVKAIQAVDARAAELKALDHPK